MNAESFAPLGDSALLIKLGEGIDPRTNDRVHSLAGAIETARPRGITDVVPAYASLAVHYDPAVASYDEILREVRGTLQSPADGAPARETNAVEIPTVYDGADLSDVAAATGMSVDEVIRLHAGREYRVYMIGFAPGFAYLGELDEKLRLPRRASPRTRVPAGSVAIADAQTAVYPGPTPGGWHLIGRTDLTMFDPKREKPSLLGAGDRVRFVRTGP